MFLEDILKDGFVNYKKVYELAEENGIKKTEVKRQKALLGVKSVQDRKSTRLNSSHP